MEIETYFVPMKHREAARFAAEHMPGIRLPEQRARTVERYTRTPMPRGSQRQRRVTNCIRHMLTNYDAVVDSLRNPSEEELENLRQRYNYLIYAYYPFLNPKKDT